MWIYEDKEFKPTEDLLKSLVGFVYEVKDLENGMKYVGKKRFWSHKRLPPLKGMKRKRLKITESDWQKYHGSSELVKSILKEHGESRFSREILRLCTSKGEMNYYEMKVQVERDVLLKPNEYYNAFVGGKIHRMHLSHLFLD